MQKWLDQENTKQYRFRAPNQTNDMSNKRQEGKESKDVQQKFKMAKTDKEKKRIVDTMKAVSVRPIAKRTSAAKQIE